MNKKKQKIIVNPKFLKEPSIKYWALIKNPNYETTPQTTRNSKK